MSISSLSREAVFEKRESLLRTNLNVGKEKATLEFLTWLEYKVGLIIWIRRKSISSTSGYGDLQATNLRLIISARYVNNSKYFK